MRNWKPSVAKTPTKEVAKDTKEAKSVSDKLDKNEEIEKGGNDMVEIDYDKIIGGVTKQMQEEERKKEQTAREIEQLVGPKLELMKQEVGTLGKKVNGVEEKFTELSFEKVKELCDAGILEACKVRDQKIKELEEKTKKTPTDGKSEEKTLDNFTAQEKFDSIKNSESALEDLDGLYADRFASDPEYRKLAFGKLSVETFVDDTKKKIIEDKLKGICQDETCRVDVEKMMKEAKKPGEKKLLKKS